MTLNEINLQAKRVSGSAEWKFPWRYEIVSQPVREAPYLYKAFLESRDANGNYRGLIIGAFRTEEGAKIACDLDVKKRTDWRSATECDAAA